MKVPLCGYYTPSWKCRQRPPWNPRTGYWCSQNLKIEQRKEQWPVFVKWSTISWKFMQHIMLPPKRTPRASTLHSRQIWPQQRMQKMFGTTHSTAIVFVMNTSSTEYSLRGCADQLAAACNYIGGRKQMLLFMTSHPIQRRWPTCKLDLVR